MMSRVLSAVLLVICVTELVTATAPATAPATAQFAPFDANVCYLKVGVKHGKGQEYANTLDFKLHVEYADHVGRQTFQATSSMFHFTHCFPVVCHPQKEILADINLETQCGTFKDDPVSLVFHKKVMREMPADMENHRAIYSSRDECEDNESVTLFQPTC